MSSPRTVRSPTTSRIAILAAVGNLPALLSIAHAQQATPAASNELVDEVIVTARNRSERAQEVPIPISVVSGDQLARDRVFTVADLTQRAPGLTATTPNARRTGISIRGIGKTSGNDNMEPAVGVIVDDVFLGHVGMTYQDFTDLERVEILRGPQGTLLGKNTSLGAIKYTSRAPSFTPETGFELEGGVNRPSLKARGSHSQALIGDTVAYRASAFYDQQEGDLENVNPSGGHWHERDRYGGRLQLLIEPSDDLSVKINADGAFTDENSNTKPFMVDPLTLNDGSVRSTTYSTRFARDYFGGYQPIIGSWDRIDVDMARPLITDNYGASAVVTWNAGPVDLTSISAARWFHFDAKNDQEQTKFAVARSGTLVDTRQLSQEFRLAGNVNERLDYQTGLYLFNIDTDTTSRNTYGEDAGAFYASDSQYRALNTATSRPLLQASLRDVFVTTHQNPVSDSVAVFGQVNWQATDRARLTLGLRQTWEWKANDVARRATLLDGSPLVSTGNATADAIRAAQTGTDYGPFEGEKITDDSIAWLVNPSYQLNDDVLLYASASAGEKSGAVAFDNNGRPANVEPEKSLNYEVGIKSYLWDRRVTLNLNTYFTQVRDYQNVTSEPDPTSPTGFSSRLGNIPELRAIGAEFDALVGITDRLHLTLSGAYNDATYTDWATATCPRSYPSSVAVCSNTGRQIVGAPRWTGIAGFDYEVPFGASFTAHFFGNYVYRSEHNLEQLLSEYGLQEGYSLTDVGAGIRYEAATATYELDVVANNVFDTRYTTSVNDFSNSAPVGYDGIGPRRYVGVVLRSNF
ncbi:iron complex outermembrane receptor protein [Povalibacter uvarum]|uniref:Iron complex outermembrane receptor protein n=1 Tax=Povalibacter uvarum TaxID=732238 RepID=A0A841HNI6_9GAMM|nr:TonB-dependent receptor [Povalibacter uvarum]MBB6093718.1 iron complex outermembrane receptor protein [Povalibacter uvarum]